MGQGRCYSWLEDAVAIRPILIRTLRQHGSSARRTVGLDPSANANRGSGP